FFPWAFYLGRYLKAGNFNLREFFSRSWPGLAVALGITLLVFFTVKPGYRVLSDETTLIAVSKSMALDQTIYNTMMGLWHQDSYIPIQNNIPRRPLLYPFSVHILHGLFGYSHFNAFIFNGAILFFMLAAVYLVGEKLYNRWFGIGMMALVAAQPVITLSATSAGFDLYSAFFFWLAVLSLYAFLRDPTSEGFALLWATLLMFENIRYESFIYHVIILVFLVSFRIVKKSYFKAHPFLYSATPLLLLPLIWQFILKPGAYENPEGTSLFSLSHLPGNIAELWGGLFDFRFFLPYATIYNLIALCLLSWLAAKIIARRFSFSENFQPRFALILTALIATNLTIILTHYFGRYTHATNARGFLIMTIGLSLTPLLMGKLIPRVKSVLAVPVGLAAFLFYHPIAVKGEFENQLSIIRENRQIYEFLQDKDKRGTVLIIDSPGQYTVLDFGSISFNDANGKADDLIQGFQQGLIREIYAVQNVSAGAQKKVLTDYELDPRFKMEKIFEFQNFKDRITRVSRVLPP
ncbi:MAG: hypothetical protein IIA62_10670, partial [Nitrospinae bacterium]|nr:hypothetical protein [Nitrospinota bacterium]